MGWLHWLAPVVGLVLLGYLWAVLHGVARAPDQRHRPPLDGAALLLLASALYVTRADPPGVVLPLVDRVLFGLLVLGSVLAALIWFRVVTLPHLPWQPQGPWVALLFGLPELVTPVGWVAAGWRRTAPLRWCLRHPYTAAAYRDLGYRGSRTVATLARWFTPDQLRRLGWDVASVSSAVAQMTFIRGAGWDAERFIRAVEAGGRDHRGHLGNWSDLHRLGIDDPSEYLRYLSAEADPTLALRYALGPNAVPYDVVVTLERLGVTKLWPLMYALQQEYRTHRTCYPGGWTDLVAWVRYDGTGLITAVEAARHTAWHYESHVRPWREWAPLGGRTPSPEPALWAAAGFTVDEAIDVLDAGEAPDAEALRGLAALRRTG